MESNKLRMAIRTIAAAAILGLASQPALAQSAAELQTQIDNMQQQLDEMKPADGAKGWVLPGTDTTMSIGGYVKLDLIYDFDQNQGDDLFPSLDIATGDVDEDSSFRAHAKQSRIHLSTSTPTAVGDVKTYIEGDFFAGGGTESFSNSDGFRIRHAYGQWGNWLAGQTWSNFMHFTAYPATVDFGGPVGVSFIRQAQLRYTAPVGEGSLSFSLENPEATGFTGARDTLPDFTARYKWAGDAGGVELGGLARQLESDNATGDESAFGYGLMAAGRVNLTDATTLMGGVIFGDGVGRYIFSAADFSQDSGAGRTGVGSAYIDDNGDLETIEALATTVAVSQQWTPKFSSGLSYGRVEGDQPSDRFPVSWETTETIHFSNFYKVADPVTLGLELSRTSKELMNGEDGDALRLQASAQVSF